MAKAATKRARKEPTKRARAPREPEPKETIERAGWLLRHRRVWTEGPERWRAFTERAGVETPYVITPEGCNCYAGENQKARRAEGRAFTPCKHEWAARAPDYVNLILAIRGAPDVLELEHVGYAFRAAVAGRLEPFYSMTRHEYARRAGALIDEMNQQREWEAIR